MKFVLAVVVQILMGLFLMWGMIHAVQGSVGLLIAGVLAYLIVFIRAGCAAH